MRVRVCVVEYCVSQHVHAGCQRVHVRCIEDDSPSFMGEDYFCESAITELSSSLAEFGKFVTVSLRV